MKYFTRDWCTGVLTENEFNQRMASYRRSLEKILPVLPQPVVDLARRINLHDGRIQQISVDRNVNQLNIKLCCGDFQTGYSIVNLTYSGVSFSQMDFPTLRVFVNDLQTELLYDEIDLDDDGHYVHRMIFHPVGELTIVFDDLQLTQHNVAQRSLSKNGDRYVEIA